ncbi:hypothetical protein JCM10213_006993 [Rhodosporidiobolus nylandii]
MSAAEDRSDWHTLSISIPFPAAESATLVKRVIEVDKPLKPSELTRVLRVDGSALVAEFQARTVSQARVALDHFFSDVQLVVQTMHKFGPKDIAGADEKGSAEPEAPSLEVGLMGSWGGLRRG